jgi:hypothetical protein
LVVVAQVGLLEVTAEQLEVIQFFRLLRLMAAAVVVRIPLMVCPAVLAVVVVVRYQGRLPEETEIPHPLLHLKVITEGQDRQMFLVVAVVLM